MKKVADKEYDRVISLVEKNTCFRFSARVDNDSAFMVPVSKEGMAMGSAINFSWKRLKLLSELEPPK